MGLVPCSYSTVCRNKRGPSRPPLHFEISCVHACIIGIGSRGERGAVAPLDFWFKTESLESKSIVKKG